MATEHTDLAATVVELRGRYGAEEPPACPVCGAAMEDDDAAGNTIPHRETWWRCPDDGARETTMPLRDGDPDVLLVLDALAAATAERDRLRAALRFYADAFNWLHSQTMAGDGPPRCNLSPVRMDGGKVARAALVPDGAADPARKVPPGRPRMPLEGTERAESACDATGPNSGDLGA